MRTEKEIQNRIKALNKHIKDYETRFVGIFGWDRVNQTMYHFKQEICLLKWVLEPIKNKEK